MSVTSSSPSPELVFWESANVAIQVARGFVDDIDYTVPPQSNVTRLVQGGSAYWALCDTTQRDSGLLATSNRVTNLTVSLWNAAGAIGECFITQVMDFGTLDTPEVSQKGVYVPESGVPTTLNGDFGIGRGRMLFDNLAYSGVQVDFTSAGTAAPGAAPLFSLIQILGQ